MNNDLTKMRNLCLMKNLHNSNMKSYQNKLIIKSGLFSSIDRTIFCRKMYIFHLDNCEIDLQIDDEEENQDMMNTE